MGWDRPNITFIGWIDGTAQDRFILPFDIPKVETQLLVLTRKFPADGVVMAQITGRRAFSGEFDPVIADPEWPVGDIKNRFITEILNLDQTLLDRCGGQFPIVTAVRLLGTADKAVTFAVIERKKDHGVSDFSG